MTDEHDERNAYGQGQGFAQLFRQSTPPPVPVRVEPEPEPDVLSDPVGCERDPAAWGRRGVVNRVLGRFGRLRPSDAEVEHRVAGECLQTQWSGTRLVAVVNPKGGQCKSPSVVMLASLFASARRGGVVAWDNSEVGTLGWRAAAAPTKSTVWDLLGSADRLAQASSSQVGAFLRRQPTGEHILAGDDSPVHMDQIGRSECDTIHTVLAKHYELIIADTGNNYLADRWQWTIEHADVLVVPAQYREDVAKVLLTMFDRLASMGLSGLVSSAVVALSVPPEGASLEFQARMRKALERKGVERFLSVPHDPDLAGRVGRVSVPRLAEGTLRAWRRVAAEVAIAVEESPREMDLRVPPVPAPQKRAAAVPQSDAPPWVRPVTPILVRHNGSEVSNG